MNFKRIYELLDQVNVYERQKKDLIEVYSKTRGADGLIQNFSYREMEKS